MEEDKDKSIALSSAKFAVRTTGTCSMFAGRCVGFECLSEYSKGDILNTCIIIVKNYRHQHVREYDEFMEKLIASACFETEHPDTRIAVFDLLITEWLDNKEYYMWVGKGFASCFKTT